MDVIAKQEDLYATEAFDFSGVKRNLALVEMGFKPPTLTSTGTTIVAVVYEVMFRQFNYFIYLRVVLLWERILALQLVILLQIKTV